MANRFLNNIRINDAYTFPASDGNDGQVITTDGAGNLAFENVSPDAASVIYKDSFTGDGNTTVFTLQNSLSDENQTQIYIDGVYQEKSTYSLSTNAITFSTAPISGHSIEVISISAINVGPTTIYQDNFTGDGTTTDFTLAQAIDNEVKTMIYFNGVYQFKNTYTLNSTTISFDTAPANGVAIEVISIASAAAEDYNQLVKFYGKATEAISKGDAVMFDGQEGDHFLLSKATQAAISANHEYFLGLASQDLTIGEFGYVTEFGKINELDTSGYTAGDILWFDAGGSTAGALTTTEPAAPLVKIQVAAVIRSHQNEGVLFVRPTWYHELGELHDVNITSIADKDLLVWNNSNSYWENSKTLSDLTLTGNLTVNGTQTILSTQTVEVEDNILQLNTTQGSPDTATATTSGISVYRGNGVTQASFIFDDADDTWDLTNNLVVDGNIGIGVTPATKLDVAGNVSLANYSGTGENQTILAQNDYGQMRAGIRSGVPYIGSITSLDFALYTGNSEKVRIDTSGNVGIGETSPSTNLHIKGASSAASKIRLQANASNDYDSILEFADNVSVRGSVLYSNYTNHLAFSTNSSEKMRITSSGNVGIGTASPDTILEIASGNSSGDAALDAPVFRINNTTESADWDVGDVVGSIEYYTSDASGNAPYVASFIKSVNETGNGTLPDGALTFGTATYNASGGAVERMRIDSGGSILIGSGATSGTPAADYRSLEIGRQGNTITGAPWKSNLYFSTNATVTAGSTAFTYRYASAAPTLMTMENGVFTWSNAAAGTAGANISWSERMRIDSSGNVGIGYTSPSSFNQRVNAPHLVVGGGNNASGVTIFSGTNDQGSINFADGTSTTDQYTGGIVYVHGSNNYMSFHTNGGTERMRIRSSGTVGIGAEGFDSQMLTIAAGTLDGAIYATSTDANCFASFRDNSSTANIEFGAIGNNHVFRKDTTEHMRIDSSGNVGIGTTNPQNKLDIYSNENVPLRVHRPSNANLDSSGAWGIGFSTRGDAITSTDDVRAGIFSYYNGNLFFATNTTDIEPDPDASARMRIDSSGYVTIGDISSAPAGTVPLTIFKSGANANLAIQSGGGSGRKYELISNTAGDFIIYDVNGTTEKLIITAAGNVGIGTSSPESGAKLDVRAGAGGKMIFGSYDANYKVVIEAGDQLNFYNGTSPALGYINYSQTGTPGSLLLSRNLFVEANPSGGTTGTVRIKSNGDVGIGTTSPAQSIDTSGKIRVRDGGNTTIPSIQMGPSGVDGLSLPTTNTIAFITNSAERMRIDSSGRMLVGTQTRTGNYDAHYFVRQADGSYVMIISNSQDDTDGQSALQLNLVNTSATTQSYFLICRQGSISTGTNRFMVYANGNAVNSNNSYGAISDSRLKENIVDATPKLNQLMQIPVKNFNLIGDNKKQIGIIAQDVEQIFPGIIDENKLPDSEDETLYKSVKYSVLVPMLLKGMQEQQEIINDLKAEVETLKNQINGIN